MKTSRITHLLATLICIFAFTEIASAWESICARGDDYIERNFMPMPAAKCGACTTWCESKCNSIDLFMIQKECREVGTSIVDCQCCCGKVAPAPGASPTPWAVPFTGDEYNNTPLNFCPEEAKAILIPREQAKDCPFNPICAAKCKEEGRSSVFSECWGASRDFVEGTYTWNEQCCCGDLLPPTPPCDSCGCCPMDINITVSVKSGGDAKVSTPSVSSPSLISL
ncbi:hypothetical protein MKW94_000858 [Papaver nudicaule]|uniref:Uncharacterized protein n=1 Tax=Papaver nudicaule TaxID=74823 RepID=A0AA42ATJ5_PAPNU|nr:hypothetical protein [Papaver nudicaule]